MAFPSYPETIEQLSPLWGESLGRRDGDTGSGKGTLCTALEPMCWTLTAWAARTRRPEIQSIFEPRPPDPVAQIQCDPHVATTQLLRLYNFLELHSPMLLRFSKSYSPKSIPQRRKAGQPRSQDGTLGHWFHRHLPRTHNVPDSALGEEDTWCTVRPREGGFTIVCSEMGCGQPWRPEPGHAASGGKDARDLLHERAQPELETAQPS